VIDMPATRPLDASLALDDQMIAIDPDGRFLGNQPSDLGADNEMILGFEDLHRGPPRGDALLPLAHERLRDVKSDLYVNR
jgi:hypothetical protein